MAHDVFHVHSLCNTCNLIQFTCVGPDVWVVYDSLAIAFEMQVVNHVKADKCGEKPPIGLGQTIAQKVALICQDTLDPIQTIKQRTDSSVIGLLACCKARFINTVVEPVVIGA